MTVEIWSGAECAAAWGVRPATWAGYVSRGQAPPPLPDTDERGHKVWDADAVRTFPRPGVGRSRAGATAAAEALLAALEQTADELDAVRARQHDLVRQARTGGAEVRAIARAARVSPQTVYGWLAD